MYSNMSSPSPPFIHNSNQVYYVMSKLVVALLPALAVWIYLYGIASMIQFFICIATCYAVEGLILMLRKKHLALFLSDGSAMVTALLLAFCLPPLSPWWLSVCACLFAMLIGKHLYGGIGQNIFNPAMLGYAIVLVSFPAEFAIWQSSSLSIANTIDLSQAFEYIFLSADNPISSSATLLSQWRNKTIPETINWLAQPSFYLNVAFLLGGGFLLLLKTISWHIPVGFLIGCVVASFLIYFDENVIDYLQFHLFTGATMIGAFFIATDPVSAASSNRGKFYYAVLIGVLMIVIRAWGNYPDGLAFAILIANLSVPLLDYYITR